MKMIIKKWQNDNQYVALNINETNVEYFIIFTDFSAENPYIITPKSKDYLNLITKFLDDGGELDGIYDDFGNIITFKKPYKLM